MPAKATRIALVRSCLVGALLLSSQTTVRRSWTRATKRVVDVGLRLASRLTSGVAERQFGAPGKALDGFQVASRFSVEHRRPNGLAVKGTAQSALSVSAQHGISGGDVLSRAGAM